MATPILSRDVPRYTMTVLLRVLERDSPQNARVAAHAVLRAAFNHLYVLGNTEDAGDPAIGQAMCTLLVLTGDRP